MSALYLINHRWLALSALGFVLLPLHSMSAVRSCDPAVIDSVVTNSPLCPGDHINLSVIASGDIIGYSWQGPGTGEYFTYSPMYSFNLQVLGEYVVVVYGECGNDTATVTVDASGAGAGQDDTLRLCDDGPPRDLALELGAHAQGGTWTFDELPHSGMYDPAIDSSGEYVYTTSFASTCPGTSQTATITVVETRVGPDISTSTCALDSAFDLVQFLPTDVTPGGAWSRYVFISLEPHSSVYDPAVDSSGAFQYAVQGCSASVMVSEDPALRWFQDADNDGFGDPMVLEWSCEQPAGYVADSTDNCSVMPGRIGDPCDDGLSGTVEDAITDSCTCAGLVTTAINTEQGDPSFFSVWPNPNTGGLLNIRAQGSGSAGMWIFDSIGKLQKTIQFEPSGGSEAIHVLSLDDLPKGMYILRLTSGGRSGSIPLVIR